MAKSSFILGALVGAAATAWLLTTDKGKETLAKADEWLKQALDKGADLAGKAKDVATEYAGKAKDAAENLADKVKL